MYYVFERQLEKDLALGAPRKTRWTWKKSMQNAGLFFRHGLSQNPDPKRNLNFVVGIGITGYFFFQQQGANLRRWVLTVNLCNQLQGGKQHVFVAKICEWFLSRKNHPLKMIGTFRLVKYRGSVSDFTYLWGKNWRKLPSPACPLNRPPGSRSVDAGTSPLPQGFRQKAKHENPTEKWRTVHWKGILSKRIWFSNHPFFRC